MTSRTIIVLGIGQCVNWGVLYYAFAVLLLPVAGELGVAKWVVTGAFSLALLTSAALAPAVGRWTDSGHGARVMEIGGFTGATLLVSWAVIPTVGTLYLVWAGLGLSMATTLYEPAFAIVGRAHDDPTDRLRALAAVTVFGGLASTVFLPCTAFLVRGMGWRGAVGVLACALAASTYMMRVFAFRHLPTPATTPTPSRTTVGADEAVPHFGVVLLVFSLASLASAAFMANLVPALGERHVSPTAAAVLGGLLGVMQLPGRALLMNGRLGASPFRLLVISLALQAAGLATLAAAPSVAVVALGITVFATGAGLTTLVRPHLVQTAFKMDKAGYLNGRLAQSQQVARAAGPIAAAWLAGTAGYAAVLGLLAALFAVLALVSQLGRRD
jgi:MFS family permease